MLLQIHEPGETPAPHEGERGIAIGIDLGTTNSVVAIAREGKPEVLRDSDGEALLPSVVAYPPGEAPAIVGFLAQHLLSRMPDRVVSSIKRLMGRAASDLETVAGSLPYRLDPSNTGGMVRLLVGDRRLTPVEISADILRAAKERAEEALGRTVERVVVTVPAYFDDAARTATRDAAQAAGLEVLRLVNEPTAAALAYGLDQGAEGLYAVYDLGGGTFDMSLLRLEKGVFQVLATGGDAALGGDDFDRLIAERFLKERGEANPSSDHVKQVLQAARLAKEALSDAAEGEFDLDLGEEASRHKLDRAGFEALIAPLVARTIAIAEGVLADADMVPADVKGVVLVGGSTRVPLVRARVAALFGQEPLTELDPDTVVALGAALQAEALTVGSDTLLLDVTPLSLGIETMGGIVEKVIYRNTPIPVAMAQEFTTYQDGQNAMQIHVVQGERETVDACRSLARFELDGIPPMTAGAARVRVTFAVDADGLLTVSAQEASTGVRQAVEVKPTYGLDEDDMANMLRASLENAAADMTRRLLLESRVEAQRVLHALDAALKKDAALLLPDEPAAIEAAAETVRSTLAGDDRDAITLAVEALEEATRPFAERRIDTAFAAALTGVSIDNLAQDFGGDTNAAPAASDAAAQK